MAEQGIFSILKDALGKLGNKASELSKARQESLEQGAETAATVKETAGDATAAARTVQTDAGEVIVLTPPGAGENVSIDIQSGQLFSLQFNVNEAATSSAGADLVFAFDNGGQITLENFFTFAGIDAAPQLLLGDGSAISAAQLINVLQALGQLEEVQPAEGQPLSSGGEYRSYVDPGTLPGPLDVFGGGLPGESTTADLGPEENLLLAEEQEAPPPEEPQEPEPPEPQPLFTENDDVVDFNDLEAGEYIDGTQYDGLGGDDEVWLPENGAEALESGYDIGRPFFAGAGNDEVHGGNLDEEIHGGEGSDRLFGGFGDDLIFGEEGSDSLFGESGDDFLQGGEGNDFIDGGSGDDDIIGGVGDDRIQGGSGDDVIQGSVGDDFIEGGTGDDEIRGGFGDDLIDGDDGDDLIFGDEGNDIIFGNDGADELYGGGGDDFVVGETGDDLIFGNSGDDFLLGDFGDDALSGGQGNDTIYGGLGNDVFTGGEGADTFAWSSGDFSFQESDLITDFNAAEGDTLDVSQILSGFDGDPADLSDFVRFVDNGDGSVTMQVDIDGAGGAATWEDLAILQGTDIDEVSLDQVVAVS